MKTNYVQYERSMLDRYVTSVAVDKQFPYIVAEHIIYTQTVARVRQTSARVLSTYPLFVQ